MAAFGLWLPRNSKDQAGAGRWVPLDALERREKENRILAQGKPLLTLLYMPGHVMLYLGPNPATGRPAAFHAMWGLRTIRLFENTSGRRVIGRTVVTSLEPGREFFPFGWPGRLLIDKLTGMVLLDGHDSADRPRAVSLGIGTEPFDEMAMEKPPRRVAVDPDDGWSTALAFQVSDLPSSSKSAISANP